MQKVTKEVWQERMKNLQNRRSSPQKHKTSISDPIGDYKKHLSKIKIGNSVLDIGCGSMAVSKYIPENVMYMGIDAFPMVKGVLEMEVEDLLFHDEDFETLIVFAMLDNVHDFPKAISEMKRVCSKNIYFLTGVNIPPDEYHTIEIKEDVLIEAMKPFKIGYREQLHEKVILIEFLR